MKRMSQRDHAARGRALCAALIDKAKREGWPEEELLDRIREVIESLPRWPDTIRPAVEDWFIAIVWGA